MPIPVWEIVLDPALDLQQHVGGMHYSRTCTNIIETLNSPLLPSITCLATCKPLLPKRYRYERMCKITLCMLQALLPEVQSSSLLEELLHSMLDVHGLRKKGLHLPAHTTRARLPSQTPETASMRRRQVHRRSQPPLRRMSGAATAAASPGWPSPRHKACRPSRTRSGCRSCGARMYPWPPDTAACGCCTRAVHHKRISAAAADAGWAADLLLPACGLSPSARAGTARLARLHLHHLSWKLSSAPVQGKSATL